MSYTTRYQVFVSSTFTDLKEERAEVLQALWELDCIPTGMEAFLASNESQWEMIRRVIDECDYYVLILGGRYGTLTTEGLSYTEMEFNYAGSLGVPILAFVHGSPEEIAVGKSETNAEAKAKLDAFRNKVLAKYPVRKWTTPHELGGLVSRSLVREIKQRPRPGWIRNDGSSPVALLERVNELSEENRKLKESLEIGTGHIPIEELSSGQDDCELYGTVRTGRKGTSTYSYQGVEWTALATWDDIFRDIGPLMLNEATEGAIKSKLSNFIVWWDGYKPEAMGYVDHNISSECFAEIIIQFRALGLIDKGVKKRGVNDKASYWSLTDHGDRYLVGLLAKRKVPEPNREIEDVVVEAVDD